MNKILRICIFLYKSTLKVIGEAAYPFYYLISRKTDFFNWQKLLKLRFSTGLALSMQTRYYGHHKILKKLNLSAINTIVEHGVYVSDSDIALDCDLFLQQNIFPVKNIVTFGERRKAVVEDYLKRKNKKNINVTAVGAYINYADNFLPAHKLANLKKELGRVLLVYPLHSIETAHFMYDTQKFIDEINKVKNDFNTVIVSVYWHDLLLGAAKPYIEAGYKIACAGRREDPFFLNRQKDLLTLSDMIISNGTGTHIGYATALNKPCCIIRQETKFMNAKPETDRPQPISNQFAAIADYFSKYSFEITPEQKHVVALWWGEKTFKSNQAISEACDQADN